MKSTVATGLLVVLLAGCGLDDTPPRYAGARGDTQARVTAMRARVARGERVPAADAKEIALATLWSALEAPSPEARAAAVAVIERAEIEPLAQAVSKRLGDDDEHVQLAAAIALLRAHPDAFAIVTGALEAADPDLRERAVLALARKLGDRAADTIAPLAKDVDPGVRAAVLGALPARDAAGPARAGLADADGGVRAAAVRALGDAEAALKLLEDPYLGARLAALDVVAEHGAEEALTSPVVTQDPYLALRAGVILAKRGETAPGAQAIDRAGRDAAWTLRAAALNALADVNPKRAIEFAAVFDKDPVPAVRLAAARALGRLGDGARATAMLRTLLDGPAGLDAALELGRAGASGAAELLHARWDDGDATARLTIVREAPALPGTDAWLLDGARDASPLVRVAAAERLWRR